MTSKKTKALRKRHQRALAREVLHSRLASPKRDRPIHTMSDRRDSSPHRAYSRPFSPPRGPRATSDKIRREERERYRDRDRSRSRSPDSARRRGSDMHDAYSYRPEPGRRGSERYLPSYNSSSPTRPPLTEARRKYLRIFRQHSLFPYT